MLTKEEDKVLLHLAVSLSATNRPLSRQDRRHTVEVCFGKAVTASWLARWLDGYENDLARICASTDGQIHLEHRDKDLPQRLWCAANIARITAGIDRCGWKSPKIFTTVLSLTNSNKLLDEFDN